MLVNRGRKDLIAIGSPGIDSTSADCGLMGDQYWELTNTNIHHDYVEDPAQQDEQED